MRSDAFRRSIIRFTLRYTDHFMHEFRIFAMCPHDMSGFDHYATYPSRPRNSTVTRWTERQRSVPTGPPRSVPGEETFTYLHLVVISIQAWDFDFALST